MMIDPKSSDSADVGRGQHDLHAELNPKIQDALGQALKAHYDDLINAPIPDRFLVLLAELEAKERRHDG